MKFTPKSAQTIFPCGDSQKHATFTSTPGDIDLNEVRHDQCF
jgi:hypothetical protein